MGNLGIILSRPCFIVNLTWMEITMHCSDTCKWSIIFINFKSMTGACLPCDFLYKWFIFLPLFIFLLDRILCMSYAYMILENVLVCYEKKTINLSLRCLLNKITVFGACYKLCSLDFIFEGFLYSIKLGLLFSIIDHVTCLLMEKYRWLNSLKNLVQMFELCCKTGLYQTHL